MKGNYNICVQLTNGKIETFENLRLGDNYNFVINGISLLIEHLEVPTVKIRTLESDVKINTVTYNFTIRMNNYAKIIAPDSGRWFMNSMSVIGFWRNFRHLKSTIGDIKFPLFIFLRNDLYMGEAIGVLGKNCETEFQIIEPESNRALNVHTGHITMKIQRGSEYYPLMQDFYEDGIFYDNYRKSPNKSWMLVMRDFAKKQRSIYKISDNYLVKALEPMWCSWVDWDSKDINEKMLLENMAAGVKLGIRNFIIDDGWYGNGLDSDYSVNMNIGDWEPDRTKISDMRGFVIKAKNIGARPIIWCAPHAVAKESRAFLKNRDYLISDGNGEPIINEPQYFSYCFRCKESREIMSDICIKLIEKWDFDGAKYDLFNWVPDCECQNPNHIHDVGSMIEGLEATLQRIDYKTRKIKQDYIVELKQNYGTIFNSRYGNIMRAGDAPFDIETNYLRTLHIQSYTPFALNDYQTFTEEDEPVDVASIIIKMMAAGIPAYGVNFSKLSDEVKAVIKYYNSWYIQHIEFLKNYRVPYNAENTVMYVSENEQCYYFIVNHANILNLEQNSMIFNGSYEENIIIKNVADRTYRGEVRDCYGKKKYECHITKEKLLNEWEVPLGGSIEIIYE